MKKIFYQAIQHLRRQPRTAAFGFIFIALMMVSSALLELTMSREEVRHLMTEQAHSLIETLLITSRNSILTNRVMDEQITNRLFNDAHMVRRLLQKNKINDQQLAELAELFKVYRINIFDKNGKKRYSSHKVVHTAQAAKHSPREYLEPIFQGQTDSLVIGFKPSRFENEMRYAVALATDDNDAIVINLNAQDILHFRKKIGYGSLLLTLAQNSGIVYVALQDEQGILAASKNVHELEPIPDSPFLASSISDSSLGTRISAFNDMEVFEAVHPLVVEGRTIGLFRLGISLKPMEEVDARLLRRIIYISVLLAFLASVLVIVVMVLQHSESTRKQSEVVESYSSNIIHNVSDAVIVLDAGDRISIFNDAAQVMFSRTDREALGQPFRKIMDCDECAEMIRSAGHMQNVECKIGGKLKFLMASRNVFNDKYDKKNTILVIRDLTDQKKMEAQVQRRERLLAMGELASGVAHEIRNPLNTIGTIVQQLDKDFEPKGSPEEYHDLAGLVYDEVRRIDRTVRDFLRFSRPEKINPRVFDLSKFISDLQKQFGPLVEVNGGSLNVSGDWGREVRWDRDQMQQVFINIIQNAVDATKGAGRIELFARVMDDQMCELAVRDDGPGIADSVRSKIFNLYFTTKARGTGIGLSIVQRIIYEHGGVISAHARPSGGTAFVIQMPLRVLLEEEEQNEPA